MIRDVDKRIRDLPKTQEEKEAMISQIGGRVRKHAKNRRWHSWNSPIGRDTAEVLRAEAALLRKIAEYPVPSKRR